MTITLHTMPFPVAEFHHMTGHLRGVERGALRDILDAQWMQEFQPVDLDDKRWFLYRTKLDPRQYQKVIDVIKPFFREVPNKGYYLEFGENLYFDTMDKHLKNVEKGKKGATAKQEKAKERLEDYNNLQNSNKETTTFEQVSNKPIHSDEDNSLENKESESVGLKHNIKQDNIIKEKDNSILNSKETHEVGNQISHSPLNGSEKPNDLKKVVEDASKSFNANYQEKVNSPKSYLDNMFDEFWANLQANNSGDTMLRYEDWKGQLHPESRDKIGQHWHDSKHNLKTTTELFIGLAR